MENGEQLTAEFVAEMVVQKIKSAAVTNYGKFIRHQEEHGWPES